MTEAANPYAAPAAEPDRRRPRQRLTLASRGARLGGALLDNLALMLPMVLLLAAFGMSAFSDDPEPGSPGTVVLASGLAGLAVLAVLVVNLVLLARNGQTIGKWLVRTKIVRANGERAGLLRLLVLRSFVLWVVAGGLEALATGSPLGSEGSPLGGIGNLVFIVDALFIFGAQRQCLHDHIADTIVVVA